MGHDKQVKKATKVKVIKKILKAIRELMKDIHEAKDTKFKVKQENDPNNLNKRRKMSGTQMET